jgi:N-acetylmuramoyl-L-alanine amidase
MRRPERNKLVVRAFVFTVIFCLTARPILNAADPASAALKPRSAAESLFLNANDLLRTLHERPLEERALSDYRRALDAYGQVIRLNTDNYFSAESLVRRAEIEREMADAAGDSELYQQAIKTYRRVIAERPNSAFVGDALINIAEIYEKSLQDLDGAAGAYRELIAHFPQSVLAREAQAVLARFESEIGSRPLDVTLSDGHRPDRLSNQLQSVARLTNVRNFTGPDYARIVVDLSGASDYSERRAGSRLSILLAGAVVSESLRGRRFIISDASLLRRIIVAEREEAGVQIDIEAGSLADYSMFRLSEPDRIVIDLHAAGAVERVRPRVAPATESAAATREARPERTEPRVAQPRPRPAAGSAGAILSLPDIPDPIVPMNPQQPRDAAAASAGNLAAKVDQKVAESPIKRIVIDPGHGGHDTGTISPNGMREKDLVLDVARRLRNYIKHNYPDIEVIMTRDSDRFIALEERTAIANSRKADLFISVHANASPSRAASGVETFFLSPDRATAEDLQAAARENARIASDNKPDKPQPVVASITAGNRVAESRELARYIQAGLVRGIGAASPRTAVNRGVKHAPFVVLLGAAMPSVLAEVSFLSNERDAALLQTTQFRDRIAASLYAGLNAYLKKNRPVQAKAK